MKREKPNGPRLLRITKQSVWGEFVLSERSESKDLVRDCLVSPSAGLAMTGYRRSL
jgi:hypothetical protein